MLVERYFYEHHHKLNISFMNTSLANLSLYMVICPFVQLVQNKSSHKNKNKHRTCRNLKQHNFKRSQK